MKKKTPKRKPAIKPKRPHQETTFIFDEVDYESMNFWGRFVLAWFFITKAFDSLTKGKATV
jgi:hypothetical protein